MAIQVPRNYSDLTLQQLVTLETIQDPIKRVEACCSLSSDDVRKAPLSVINEANEYLNKLQKAETRRHLKVIELRGQEYGFIPDWEAFTTGEWIDLETYVEDFWTNAHKIMAVLYRPIERRSGNSYTITPYTAKEPSEAFLDMPADLFAGCMLFFSTSRREQLNIMRSCLQEVTEKATNLAISGDGIPSCMDSPQKTSSRWMQFQHYLSELPSRTLHFSKT